MLLPARAGMVHSSPRRRVRNSSAPRTRGDGPLRAALLQQTGSCSPHARGWSRARADQAVPAPLLPARAGMVPRSPIACATSLAAPRTRGDGPPNKTFSIAAGGCSPHARGWSHRHGVRLWRLGLPPHARGWSRAAPLPRRRLPLLPARAGMVPAGTCPRRRSRPAPRTRWDDPGHLAGGAMTTALLPARAGMVPSRPVPRRSPRTAPRTRRDGPEFWNGNSGNAVCSLHVRGWSPAGRYQDGGGRLLPARAGMAPVWERSSSARGLLPARAGMAPGRASGPGAPHPAPRTRGDGPVIAVMTIARALCSPHARGWSRHVDLPERHRPLLPARAGMVPR